MTVQTSVLDYWTIGICSGLGYGLLYNWYAVTDTRNITATGWHIPTMTELFTFRNYLNPNGGYKLRDTGTVYWDNSSGTNQYGFNAKGTGHRLDTDGTFILIKQDTGFWSSDDWFDDPTLGALLNIIYNVADCAVSGDYIKRGYPLRPMKDSTTLSEGQTGTYTGNDGKVYPTICIGTSTPQEFLSRNLRETKYRNQDSIPEVTSNSAWTALTTGALCAYNNDWDNV